MDCIFCKIEDHEIAHRIIYEDEKCFVIPDRRPINPGHLLVIPKIHEPDFWKVNKKIFEYISSIAQKFATILNNIYLPKKIEFWIAGFDVSHTHIHIVPVYHGDDIAPKSSFNKENIEILTDQELEKIRDNIKLKL
jgi:histidine triad (HIT) family protein